MKEFSYVIKDSIGIYAKSAELLVKEAERFKSEITLMIKGRSANAKKLFSVMSLSGKNGDVLKISIFGLDEDMAEHSIKRFLEQNL